MENINTENQSNENSEHKKLYFKNMTPIDYDDMSGYEEALDYVFSKDEILNIAITGPYSAGKSSVINTYEKNKNKKSIHISLAEFADVKDNHSEDDEDNSNESYKKNRRKHLEGNIINQLIHQISLDKISRTDFKVKPEVSGLKILINTVGIAIFVLITLYMTNFDTLNQKIGDVDIGCLKSITTSGAYIGVTIVYFALILYFVCKIVIKYLNKPFLKTIKINDTEVELFDDTEDSIFNKHLDEIIYIISQSDVDEIVFEDIDRYNDIEIFTNLREINILVNKKINLGKEKKCIKFIYLIKDDLFLSKDRTKFFDFILPIIPVVNSSNSYKKLIELLKHCEVYEKLDNIFIERICLYIDDMRLINNIYNEFVIYVERLKKDNIYLDYNKLLAMLVYKNIFPKDFSDLLLNRGYVFNVLSNKNKLIENKVQAIEEKIEKIKSDINESNNEMLMSEDELDAINFNKLDIELDYYIYNKKIREYDNLAEAIRAIKDNDYNVNEYSYNSSKIDIKDRFNKLNENDNYRRIKEKIKLKNNNERRRLIFHL